MARQNEFRRPHDFTGGVARRVAGDFTADRRMLLLIAMAIVALVYALWPANRGRFDRAAKSILDDGGDAPLDDDEDKPCR